MYDVCMYGLFKKNIIELEGFKSLKPFLNQSDDHILSVPF